MPAKKHSSLNKRHDTKDEKAARKEAEDALIPKTKLTQKPPRALTGHPHARAVWTRVMKLYSEIQGDIITAFDEDLLVKYCLAEEELIELFELRKQIKKLWTTHSKWLEKLNPKGTDLKIYFSALEQANALLTRFQGMDARLDTKRKMVVGMAQSLYLTPRSRAGVAPEEKENEEPKSEMEKVLDEE